MKKQRRNEGFTLVELIVVIAILGILAAVAVPAYSGYIKKANDAAVLTELSAIHTAAQASAVINGTTVVSITVSNEGVNVETADATLGGAVNTAFGSFYTGADQLWDKLTNSASYTEGAIWSAADGDAEAGWSSADSDAIDDIGDPDVGDDGGNGASNE